LRKPPRSAWRLDFGSAYADKHLKGYASLPAEDLLATFTEFTALAISRSITQHVKMLDQASVLIASGGGVYQEAADPDRMADFASDEDLVGRWLGGPYPCGLQIGEPAIVATACDTPAVTQFRPSDHALGGSGAPLMQYLDFVAFRDIGPVLTLNSPLIKSFCRLLDTTYWRSLGY
jgi:1,6-anhydro-N-acetylmuramate kinase